MITIYDAVMGTGKSSYVIDKINSNLNSKFLVLVPLITEVNRYVEGLSLSHNGSRNDVVGVSSEGSSNLSVREQIINALKDNKTVIATHSGFTEINEKDLEYRFTNIGEYSLIIDETIVLVDKKKIPKADIKSLEENNFISVSEDPRIKGLQYYKLTNRGLDYINKGGISQKKTINAISGKHVYIVNKTEVVFVVPPEKLLVFKNTIILTYLFDKSETHGWLKLFNIDYSHKKMSRIADSAYAIEKHDCIYSGTEFNNLLKIYDHTINNIGNKTSNKRGFPLSMNWFDKKGRNDPKFRELMNNTKTFFRHMNCGQEEMLWTCFKDFKDWVRDSRFDPISNIACVTTWLSQDARGTNEYKDRHFLAFLVNVHPPVPLTLFFGGHKIDFDSDNYALSRVLQWTWRSAIRKGDEVTLYLPSQRMRILLQKWLN